MIKIDAGRLLGNLQTSLAEKDAQTLVILTTRSADRKEPISEFELPIDKKEVTIALLPVMTILKLQRLYSCDMSGPKYTTVT